MKITRSVNISNTSISNTKEIQNDNEDQVGNASVSDASISNITITTENPIQITRNIGNSISTETIVGTASSSDSENQIENASILITITMENPVKINIETLA